MRTVLVEFGKFVLFGWGITIVGILILVPPLALLVLALSWISNA